MVHVSYILGCDSCTAYIKLRMAGGRGLQKAEVHGT